MSAHLSFPLLAADTDEMWGCLESNTARTQIYFCRHRFQICPKKQSSEDSNTGSLFSVDPNHPPRCIRWKMSSQFCQEILSHAGREHRQSRDAAHSVPPSVCTEGSQSPDCVLLKEQHGSLTSYEYTQHKVALQLKPTHSHRYVCLPTCSPRLLRMLDSSMAQSPGLSCLPTGAKPRCTAWLQPPAPSLPPSG